MLYLSQKKIIWFYNTVYNHKCNNSKYRPILLLSCIGKVMESAVYKYTYYFIFEHSLLYAYQSGFINGHSTVYQLLEMYHRVC
jgi:hypothetical protein